VTAGTQKLIQMRCNVYCLLWYRSSWGNQRHVVFILLRTIQGKCKINRKLLGNWIYVYGNNLYDITAKVNSQCKLVSKTTISVHQ